MTKHNTIAELRRNFVTAGVMLGLILLGSYFVVLVL